MVELDKNKIAISKGFLYILFLYLRSYFVVFALKEREKARKTENSKKIRESRRELEEGEKELELSHLIDLQYGRHSLFDAGNVRNWGGPDLRMGPASV